MSKEKKDPNTPLPPNALDTESDLPPDADLEERFNDFWKKNGVGIFGGIAVGALIVVGIQLYQYMQEEKEDAIREAFAAAETIEAKASFAEAHPDHQLAALAELQIADARYDTGLYNQAADLYASAAQDFLDPTLATRARLGQGVSLLQAGEMEAGRALLQSVALDNAALDQTRGEAAYHLAVSYWEAGEREEAVEATNIILQLDSASFWAFRANALRERLGAPEAPEVAEATEGA